MNDEYHEERLLQRLSRRERFEVRRAVYNGSAVKDSALAAVAVAHAGQLKARPRHWSRRWYRSFLLDPFDVPTYVVFSVVLLVIWTSLVTVAILVGGFLLIALMTRRRRWRKADQAEAANQRLLQEPRHGGARDPKARP
jgi:Flp pilus assembly protein TadB